MGSWCHPRTPPMAEGVLFVLYAGREHVSFCLVWNERISFLKGFSLSKRCGATWLSELRAGTGDLKFMNEGSKELRGPCPGKTPASLLASPPRTTPAAVPCQSASVGEAAGTGLPVAEKGPVRPQTRSWALASCRLYSGVLAGGVSGSSGPGAFSLKSISKFRCSLD